MTKLMIKQADPVALTSGSALLMNVVLLEKKLSYCCDVVAAVHPCVASARIHCLVVDSSILEVLLKLERRLVEEV
jgi:hypothetical protein